MSRTILVTRAKGDEQAIKNLLAEQGHHVIHEPLTEIFLLHHERLRVEQALSDDPDAVLLTSRHGAQALALLTEIRDMYVLCVGEATAEMAESLGFTRVAHAGGTVDQLIDYIRDAYDDDARFVYISGVHIRADLPQILETFGMRTEQISVYDAIASTQLSDTVTEQLKRGQIDAVTFMSPRTAQIFTHLLTQAELANACETMTAYALSHAVADALEARHWQQIVIADEPTLASIVKCIYSNP